MATLEDFRKHIDAGGAACRWNGYGSALVFRLDGVYFVGGIGETDATECWTWDEVLNDLGEDWYNAGNWQKYRLTRAEVAR